MIQRYWFAATAILSLTSLHACKTQGNSSESKDIIAAGEVPDPRRKFLSNVPIDDSFVKAITDKGLPFRRDQHCVQIVKDTMVPADEIGTRIEISNSGPCPEGRVVPKEAVIGTFAKDWIQYIALLRENPSRFGSPYGSRIGELIPQAQNNRGTDKSFYHLAKLCFGQPSESSDPKQNFGGKCSLSISKDGLICEVVPKGATPQRGDCSKVSTP